MNHGETQAKASAYCASAIHQLFQSWNILLGKESRWHSGKSKCIMCQHKPVAIPMLFHFVKEELRWHSGKCQCVMSFFRVMYHLLVTSHRDIFLCYNYTVLIHCHSLVTSHRNVYLCYNVAVLTHCLQCLLPVLQCCHIHTLPVAVWLLRQWHSHPLLPGGRGLTTVFIWKGSCTEMRSGNYFHWEGVMHWDA